MSAEATNTESPSLYELFGQIPDPRDPRGIRHPLPALLTLAVTAILTGAKTLTDIAQFGLHRKKLRKAIGFTRGKSPCISTFHYLFKVLPATEMEKVVRKWLQAHDPDVSIVHFDGKTLRGSRDGKIPGIHLLAAYVNTLGTALTQVAVDAKTNEHKAALQLLRIIPLKGALVSGDAAFAQREIAEAVIEGEGDYLLTVKDNQPKLKQAMEDAFDAPVSPSGHRDPA